MHKKRQNVRSSGADANRDPISGSAGAHPVETGDGGDTGALVGAFPPGKGAEELVHPAAEDEYWRANYGARPYTKAGAQYDRGLEPAYRYGWEARARHNAKPWKEVERELASGWDKARGASKLSWEDAKLATRDAWDHAGQDDGTPTGTPPRADGERQSGVTRRKRR